MITTMKSIRKLVTFSLLLVGASVCGQGYTFKVLANKGTNEVKRGNEWKPLKTGTSLNYDDELKLSESAYIGLVHSSGKTLELQESGNIKISELASKINTGGSSLVSKYADFVLSKISVDKEHNRLAGTREDVHRAVENASIKIYIPKSSYVFNNKVLIEWTPIENKVDYTVKVVNLYEEELLTAESNTNKYFLDLNHEKLADENPLLVTINVKDNVKMKSEQVAIKRLSDDKAEIVKTNLGELISDMNLENALNNYIMAGFYEANSLLLDALFYYEKAVKLAPDVDSYQEAYEEFLLRNGLN